MGKTLILIILTSLGCTNAKNASTSVKKIQLNETTTLAVKDLIVKRKFDKSEAEFNFKIKETSFKNNILILDLTYGGGCVDEHVFEFYSTGKVDENGVVDLYLLHKTVDHCKMLLLRQKAFDISKISNKRNVSAIRINDGETFSLKTEY